MPLMVYPKVLSHPNFSINGLHGLLCRSEACRPHRFQEIVTCLDCVVLE